MMKRIVFQMAVLGLVFPAMAFAQETLTLERALDLALKNNFDIRVSRHSYSKTQVNNTLGNAGMLPTVSLSGSGALSTTTDHQRLSDGSRNNTNPDKSSASAALELDWTLFDGGKMFVTREKLQQSERLGEIQYRSTVLQTSYDVVAAYYDIVRLKQQLRSIEESIRYNEERVTISETAYKNGSKSKTDLLQAKIDLNESSESALTQKLAIREAKRNLNILLARKPDIQFEVSDAIDVSYVPDEKALFKQLNENNTSLLAFQKEADISKLAYDETKSNYLPKFDLTAAWNQSVSRNSVNTTRRSSSSGPELSGRLSIPIYQAGEANRQKKLADLSRQSADADLERVRLEVNSDLQNMLEEFSNQKVLMEIEQDNCLLAKELLEISLERLRLGQTTSLEVHQAQENYVQSNTRLINYKFALKLAETRLKQLVSAL
jgi:outer membrane protein